MNRTTWAAANTMSLSIHLGISQNKVSIVVISAESTQVYHNYLTRLKRFSEQL